MRDLEDVGPHAVGTFGGQEIGLLLDLGIT
jgi:hypothetical protein